MIPGPAGRLEALLEANSRTPPRLAALVCHPHPQFGGSMHNKVVFRAAKAALQAGLPAMRFNFRGVGKSQGTFTAGIGEREDVRAALDYLDDRFPATAVCLIGFSFGALVGLRVGATDPRVAALVGLGVPVATTDMSFLRTVAKPKLIIQGTRDEFGPREQLAGLYESLLAPKQIHWVQDADHFFTEKLDEVQEALRAFLREILAGFPRSENSLGPPRDLV